MQKRQKAFCIRSAFRRVFFLFVLFAVLYCLFKFYQLTAMSSWVGLE